MVRSYRVDLVKRLPGLLCLDGEELSAVTRDKHSAVDYQSFSTAEVSEQSLILVTIGLIKGMPQPDGYKVR